MPKSKVFPKFNSYEKAAEWLDSHSTANLEVTEVQFEVALPLKLQLLDSLGEIEDTIMLEKEISQQIQQIAKKKGISTHKLIHKWLQEQVAKCSRID